MSLALLVPGAGGALGAAVLELVRSERNTFARGLRHEDLDLTDPFAVKDMVSAWGRTLRADSAEHRLVVINAAAVTDVEAGEDAAYAVNAAAPALLAQACAAVGARLVHVSCADVFAGEPGVAYDVDDEPAPGSAYGRTKLAGEQAVRALLPDAGYVVRTGWLHGRAGHGIVAEAAAGENRPLTVSAERQGSPTWTRDLAAGLLALAGSDVAAGTYHCVNAGSTTELGLARAALEAVGGDAGRLQPGAGRPRPGAGVLSPRSWASAGLPALPDWRASLAACLDGPDGRRGAATRPSAARHASRATPTAQSAVGTPVSA